MVLFAKKIANNIENYGEHKEIQKIAREEIKKVLKSDSEYVFIYENKKKKGKKDNLAFNIVFRPKTKFSAMEKCINNNLKIGRKTLMIGVHFNLTEHGVIDISQPNPVSFRLILGSKISSYLPEIQNSFIANKKILIDMILNGEYKKFALKCLEISNKVFINDRF